MKTDHLPRVWDEDIDDWDEDCRLYKGEYFTGMAYTTYENGQIMVEGLYIEGLPHGPHREWYEDGQLKVETLMVRNFGNLGSREWHQNGQLSKVSDCLYGWPTRLREWDEQGQMIKDEEYKLQDSNYKSIEMRKRLAEVDKKRFYIKYGLT